ncbi:LON peptidase substrate-binding domain-containing protein [Roseivirga sp. BDSF3-8]|uniref:LON peptidase substrate-binding domain-containing protein n=1 Tax=Roseivirga sp. BDSF3-8 TaxID=3241598 RepID=UPI0035321558
MKSYLPLFPLNIVVFPGEAVNLHIFEPRYKQLINECNENQEPFGIPLYQDSKISYGTEVTLNAIEKVYPDGRMDVKTKGNRVLHVLSFDNPAEGKLYAGGEVEFVETDMEASPETTQEMIRLAKELYQNLNVVQEVSISDDVNSFDLGHKIGLSVEQEFALLQIEKEEIRQLFIIAHLKKAIPMLMDIERTKERIRMNGHFRTFDPLDF